MEKPVREEILSLEQEIYKYSKYLKLPSELFQNEYSENLSERKLTEEFDKKREERGMSDYEFALLHMIPDKRIDVEKFASEVEDMFFGKVDRIKKSHERFIDSFLSKIAGKTDQEKIQILRDEYAKANVASYYQRFEPVGYSDLMGKLKSGDVEVSKLMDPEQKARLVSEYPAAKFVEISPDYTWLADINSEDNVNKRYKTEGYYVQPKIDKYFDNTFTEKYGITKEQYLESKTGNLEDFTPTRNKEEYEYLKHMITLRKLSNQNNDSENTVNPYLRVQMSNTNLEKIMKLGSAQALGSTKEALKDLTSVRVDDKDFGQSVEGLSAEGNAMEIKIIPKYFQTKLPDPSELTDNTLQAAVMDLKQSIIRKNRVKYERDIRAIEYQISQQSYKKGVFGKEKITKKGQASNWYQFTNSFVNHHLYGVKQDVNMSATIAGRKIDLSRSITSFQNFVGFSNLAYNPIVDATSAVTGVVTNFSDRLAGDLYHKSSADKANNQMLSLTTNFIAETSKVDKKSKLTMLGEFCNIESLEERVTDSAQGRGMKFLGSLGFKMSKFANLPIAQRNLLLALNDFKFVDGDFVNFNTFRNKLRLQDPKIKASQINAKWSANKDTLINNLEVTEKGVKPTSEFESKFENPKEKLSEVVSKVATMTRQINQRADGRISSTDRTRAQRNVFMNTLMMHSGWLPILITKRFKAGHYNMDLNTWEEG
ncbi:MAG: hypothetical protein WD512_16190, partial [Candidatus Paceibacterota bacterium]